MPSFPFLTGFESTQIHGTGKDVLGGTRHVERWKHDLNLVRAQGVTCLRYPVPWHRIEMRRGVYDWRWMDEVLAHMRATGLDPIVDPIHHTSSREKPLWRHVASLRRGGQTCGANVKLAVSRRNLETSPPGLRHPVARSRRRIPGSNGGVPGLRGEGPNLARGATRPAGAPQARDESSQARRKRARLETARRKLGCGRQSSRHVVSGLNAAAQAWRQAPQARRVTSQGEGEEKGRAARCPALERLAADMSNGCGDRI